MTHERALAIVEELEGTCKSVEDVLDSDENAMDAELVETIDAEIFCCETCSWWCEWSEESEQNPGSCTDHDEEGDDDDDA